LEKSHILFTITIVLCLKALEAETFFPLSFSHPGSYYMERVLGLFLLHHVMNKSFSIWKNTKN